MTNPLIYEKNIASPLTEAHITNAFTACKTKGVRVTQIELSRLAAGKFWDSLAAETDRSLEPIKQPYQGPSFDSIPLVISDKVPRDTLIMLDRDGAVVARLEGITL